MKFLVVMSMAETANPPPEVVDQLSSASKDWAQGLIDAGKMESPYVFPEGGGMEILNADSPEELQELLHSNPSSPFLKHEIHLLLEFHESMDRLARQFRSGLERAALPPERAT